MSFRADRLVLVAAALGAVSLLGGCPPPGVGVACFSTDDCPDTLRCVEPNPGGAPICSNDNSLPEVGVDEGEPVDSGVVDSGMTGGVVDAGGEGEGEGEGEPADAGSGDDASVVDAGGEGEGDAGPTDGGPSCGDDVVTADEECDGASPGCLDCVIVLGWACSGSPSTCTTICGDGLELGAEQCDDGDLINGDGCSSTCQDEMTTPPDCSAVDVMGTTTDCDDLLSLANYCATVYPSPSETNFDVIGACGNCSASYFQPPAGVGSCPNQPGDAGPAPDASVIPPSTCKTCHAADEYDGMGSLEDPHPWQTLGCTECHGGDPTAVNPVFAHVCPPPEIGSRQEQVLDPRAFFLSRTTAGVELLADYECTNDADAGVLTTALDWLAFRSPGDLRAARAGLGCGGCHGDSVNTVSRGTMSTAAGIFTAARSGAGIENVFPGRRATVPTAATDSLLQADYGAIDLTIDDDAGPPGVGVVPSVLAPPVVSSNGTFPFNGTYSADAVNNSFQLNAADQGYPNSANNFVAEALFQEVLNQACTGCHLNSLGDRSRAGDYRALGCAACHFATGTSGRSASADPNINHSEPVNPNFLSPGERAHLTNHRARYIASFGPNGVLQGVSDDQCRACHSGTNYTVAQFRGYRLDQNQDLSNGNHYPSNNTVTFTYRADLFGDNQRFSNRQIAQWIDTEIWQADVANFLASPGQDETPADVHHVRGMVCIDCHGLGAVHGNGSINSRMKNETHSDVRCETCHGTVDGYAANDGTNVVDESGRPLLHIAVTDALQGDFWLVSKGNGSLHYVPQVRDIVNAIYAAGDGKQYPPGSARANQPLFSYVASYAMGRYQDASQLSDGFGPQQPSSAGNLTLTDGFSHSDGFDDVTSGGGLECYTCHSAWQNNCIGCHLDALRDNNSQNFFFSSVTGERVRFNYNANVVYQNPIQFMMGINDRGRISPFVGVHRWFSYTDLNQSTSSRVAWSDRNGLGNDPAQRNPARNSLPALSNQPFVPHTIRGRYTTTEIGGRGCLDCHLGNVDSLIMWDQNNNSWDLTSVYADNYRAAAQTRVAESRGLGTGLWLFDADGNSIVDTNGTPAFDLDRIVESDGTTNSSSNHPLLDPFGTTTNPDYVDALDTNDASVSRPLTSLVLTRLQALDGQGLTDVYYWNVLPSADPVTTSAFVYFLNDYNYDL